MRENKVILQCNAELDPHAPNLCTFHLDAFGLREKLQTLGFEATSMLCFVQEEDRYPVEAFGAVILGLGISFSDSIKLITSPCFFWNVNPTLLAFALIFGPLQFAGKPIPDQFSYVYVLDIICDMIPHIMNNGEDYERLGMVREDLQAVKCALILRHLSECMSTLFLATSMLPPFESGWHAKWEFRMNHWLDAWETIMDPTDIQRIQVFFNQLMRLIGTLAPMSQEEPMIDTNTLKILVLEDLKQKTLE